MAERIIMHIDMDAFFASVEVKDNPGLKGKPVAVAGSNERTVIVSPSYEARAFGVKTGMTKTQAKRLCPAIKFVTANSHKYTTTCSKIIEIIYSFTPDIEVYSIDEFFIDVTNTYHLFGSPEETAAKIKNEIKRQLGLVCTIGISYNKFLAKTASDSNKPDGLLKIGQSNKDKILEPLNVASIWGIGPSTARKLYDMGINTLGDLKKVSCQFLEDRFGAYGMFLYRVARGQGDDEVVTRGREQEAKSIGHSMTFQEDTKDIKTLRKYLLELCLKVSERMRRENFSGKCISLTVRYKSFKTFTKQKTVSGFINTTAQIHSVAAAILESITLTEPVRLLGVSASGLKHDEYNVFLFKEEEKKHNLDTILDKVGSKFGEGAITFASLVNKRQYKRVISPAWRPFGARSY